MRLDKKNAVRGCIHLTELAEPGQDAKLPTSLPQGPMHVVVLGAGDCAKAPLQLPNPNPNSNPNPNPEPNPNPKRNHNPNPNPSPHPHHNPNQAPLQLTIRPSALAAEGSAPPPPRLVAADLALGQLVPGWVSEAKL